MTEGPVDAQRLPASSDDGSRDIAMALGWSLLVCIEWSSIETPGDLPLISAALLAALLGSCLAFPAIHAMARRVGGHRRLLGSLVLCGATVEGARLEASFLAGDPACYWLLAPWLAVYGCWLLMRWMPGAAAILRLLPGPAMAVAAVAGMTVAWLRAAAK